MSEPTMPDHYKAISSRKIFDVLDGDDVAGPLIEACSTGNNTALQTLLSQPDWSKIMLGKQFCIKSENRPVDQNIEKDSREVTAGAMLNLERAMNRASINNRPEVVSTLLEFAKQQDIELLSIIRYWAVLRVIQASFTEVLEAYVAAEPTVVTFHMGHGNQPLDVAVRSRKTAVVECLFRLGATVEHPGPYYQDHRTGSYGVSLLSKAARTKNVRMTGLMLEHGATIPQSGALHVAAEWGNLDVMRFLIERGANVNERLAENTLPMQDKALYASYTPLHFAALGRQREAMELLESFGALSDEEDMKGRIAVQLFEERIREREEL